METIPAEGEEEHRHKLTAVEEKDAECLAVGNRAYWLCEGCGKLFADKDAKTETTAEAVTIPETGHTWDEGEVTKEPTAKEPGEKTYTCEKCGAVVQKEIAPAGGTDEGEDDDDEDIPEVGDSLIDEDTGNLYRVTQMAPRRRTVSYLKSGNKSAKTATIPSTVTIDGYTYKITAVAPKAFANNKKLTKVIIAGNVETIGKQAFLGCKKLKTVTLGGKVKAIEDKAFCQCPAIERITIPANVARIGKQAFYKCKNLKNITFKTAKLTSKKVGSQAFKGLPSKAVVKVPKGKMNTYRKMLLAKGLSRKVKIKR